MKKSCCPKSIFSAFFPYNMAKKKKTILGKNDFFFTKTNDFFGGSIDTKNGFDEK